MAASVPSRIDPNGGVDARKVHVRYVSLWEFSAGEVLTHVLIVGGNATFPNILNNFVHVLMYFYYMLAAMGPQYQKYLWWKRYMTELQMVRVQ